jgi:transcriptional regulator with XRE-family HTH domain
MEQNLDIPDVVIGSKIQAVFESRNMRLSDFADELGTVRQNVYRIFKKKHLDTGLLTKVSEVLNHNFFGYYNTQPTDSSKSDQTVASLQQQLELSRQEIDYLKRIILLMDEKARLLKIVEDSGTTSGNEQQNGGEQEHRVAHQPVSLP